MDVRDTMVITTGFGIWLGTVREMEKSDITKGKV